MYKVWEISRTGAAPARKNDHEKILLNLMFNTTNLCFFNLDLFIYLTVCRLYL